MESTMNKLLTIGLAAATLAGGVAASSGAAQAADWGGRDGHYDGDHNRGGERDRGEWRGERDRGEWRGERDRGEWRGRDYGYGYGYRRVCRTYRTWNPYWGRYTTQTRCY